ncbi:NADH dehydrogenase-like protein [Geminocystis sp. NIES-3708]|uniref:FAD-dependent oxidoreductase n=1 Tax=Geminocystis sp. NIES-3708 TaxID=1615909 RepID=UPI0005FC6ABF|nr:FAD-dependent oxidoreductase [Geminocystis sp. NIES-3708]BAQ60691.1 NADH dehydrogenase-like protein [Geminocystis sp. NIES-3708]
MLNLVFIGGGHSHVIALKLWGEQPVSGVNFTMISNVKKTPYSGMLPGYLAGYYNYDQSHIDLEILAKFAKIKLIIDSVIDIDTENKKIICDSKNIIDFDLLSVDIGSTPKNNDIEGAKLYTIPVKPVNLLIKKWEDIINKSEKNKMLILNIIGGGAGGVELAMNIHQKLSTILTNENFKINLIHKQEKLLSNYHKLASKRITNILKSKNINIYLNSIVKKVYQDHLITKSGLIIKGNYHFLVTQASAPLWLKNGTIATDKEGFILIKNTLQSINYDYIFATGDIATMINYSYPKAGVFAVKQGKPLYENICNWLNKKPLKSYHPQKYYLNIIGIGNQSAVAIWGNLVWESPLVWQWKKYLDHTFMEQFRHL